jgi:hypothetical protein
MNATRTLVSALALTVAAGGAMAQQDYGSWGQPGAGQQFQQDRFTTRGFEPDRQQWRTTTSIPQLRGVDLTLAQMGEETDTFVRIEDGQIVSASVDGRPVSREQVQVRGDRIRVLDHDGDTSAIFRIPPVAQAMGLQQQRLQRQFGMQDRQWQDRPFEQRLDRQGQRFQQPPGMGGQRPGSPQMPVADMRTSAVGILMHEAEPHHFRGTDYNSGVRVDAIQEGMPAHHAGIRRGDVIVAVDGREDVTPERLRNYLRQVPSGERLSFTIIRDGQERNLNVRTTTLLPANVNWDYMVTGLDDRQLRHQQMMLDRQRQIRGFQEGRLYGIGLTEADEDALEELEEIDQGLEVTHVNRGTILHQAGLRSGDVIVGVDGRTGISRDDLKNILEEKNPGDTLRLRIMRDNRVQTVNVPMGQTGW